MDVRQFVADNQAEWELLENYLNRIGRNGLASLSPAELRQLGVLYRKAIGGRDRYALCFTLEDEYRRKKVPEHTRIPAGTYRILLRTADSPSNARYRKRYGERHLGMLWLQDVPGFRWIYIHVGNKDDHTAGCILVGDTLDRTGSGFLGKSRTAYDRLYFDLAPTIEAGDEVWITIEDGDTPRISDGGDLPVPPISREAA